MRQQAAGGADDPGKPERRMPAAILAKIKRRPEIDRREEPVDSLLRKQWKQFIFRAIPACIAILGWQVYVSSVTHSREYQSPNYEYERAAYMYYNVPYADNIRLVDPFKPERGVAKGAEMRRRVLDNVTQLPKSIGEVLTSSVSVWQWLAGKVVHKLHLPKPSNGVITAILFIFRALPLIGLAMLLCRRDWMIPTIVAASVALMCMTPWPGQFARYLTPVAGLLILCAAIAAVRIGTWIAGKTKKDWTQPIPLGLAVAISFVAAFPMAAKVYAPRLKSMFHPAQPVSDRLLFYYDDSWTSYADALDWLRATAKPNSILATDTPHWAYIRTGLKSVMLPLEKNPVEARRLLDTIPATYVVLGRPDVGEITSRYGAPAVVGSPDWQRVYTGTDGITKIYQRKPTP